MPDDSASQSADPNAPAPSATPRRWRRLASGLVAIAGAYLGLAYLVLPFLWIGYAHIHPALDAVPGITLTGDDHPGDPVNVALVGSEADVRRIMQTAKWFPADALGLRSDLRIATDTVLKRAYDAAPVSRLYLFGRVEDLAFEQPVGGNPGRRHHVRFWKSAEVDDHGRPLWTGSASYDERAGLSHTTGQITHHISGDVDAERDHLFDDLKQTGDLVQAQVIDGFHKVREGRNGGGDRWTTDGRLFIGIVDP